MIKEAIDRILEFADYKVEPIEGRIYSSKLLHPIESPLDAKETICTLTGLVDLIDLNLNNLQGRVFIHVASPTQVFCEDILCDFWGRRQYHIAANLPSYGRFNFGNYLEQDRFIVGLQAFFDPLRSPDLDYLLQIASNLKAENSVEATDDGLSQTAAVKRGIVLAERVAVKRRVVLSPWRTFREVQQPQSEFIFRLRSEDGKVPTLALFEADGEMWQTEAMATIKAWLMARVTIKVVA